MGKNRVVNVKVLPGEATDGSGRVCIHLFVQDEVLGSFTEPHALHSANDERGQLTKIVTRPTRGRLACDPNRIPSTSARNNEVNITMRTDDPRAVTCPKCMASRDYTNMSNKIALAEAAR